MAQVLHYNYGSGLNHGAVLSRIGWGAILAGVITGMVVHLILSLLGGAIGLNVLDPGGADANAQGVSIGTGVWMLISAIISGFCGGWVASFFANIENRIDGLIHGVLSWGVFMVITAVLMGLGLGTLVGMVSSALTGASQGIAISESRDGNLDLRDETRTPVTQMQQQARTENAERVADVAAGVTWSVFLTAVLSLLASILGGLNGVRSRIVDSRTVTT